MGGPDHIYELTVSGNCLEIRFSSSIRRIDEVCSAVSRFLVDRDKGFEPHLFAINLVMREGLTNAVRHGNKNRAEKLVEMVLDISPGQGLNIRIADQGEGFDWQGALKSEMPEEADHGRGLPIMGTYFTRFRYNARGNILYLEKEILPKV